MKKYISLAVFLGYICLPISALAAYSSINIKQNVTSNSSSNSSSKTTLHVEQNGQVIHQVWEDGKLVTDTKTENTTTPTITPKPTINTKLEVQVMKKKLRKRMNDLTQKIRSRWQSYKEMKAKLSLVN